MNMTHYMELLATNQPWNLIIFMAIPIILAETVAVTELGVLFTRNMTGLMHKVNRYAGILGGIYFSLVFIYIVKTVAIPLTLTNGWRGPADVIAVVFYLLGVIPLLGITLLDLGVLSRQKTAEQKLKLHATFVAVFLIIAHIAMIFGMLNPNALQHQYPSQQMPM